MFSANCWLVRRVLNNRSFLLVLGPNGSGKSTLLREYAAMMRQEKGGESFCHVGHRDALKPYLTVAETLGFWATMLSASEKAAQDAAQAVGELLPIRVGHLSFGQRRLVCLSRLQLAQRPLWILDEPDVGLDSKSQLRLSALINRHTQVGGKIVMASHKPPETWPSDDVLQL